MASARWFRKKSSLQLREKSNKDRNREIDKGLWEDKKRLDREVKLLLLGAGESGKSTIVKQMRIIHNGGFDEVERRRWRNIIFRNLVDAFLDILKFMESENIELQQDHNMVCTLTSPLLPHAMGDNPAYNFPRRITLSYCPSNEILVQTKGCRQNISTASKIYGMTMASRLQYCEATNGHYTTISSSYGFLERLDCLFETDYLPSNQDILRAKLRTKGIHETLFDIGGWTFRMVDVGGQRSERKKWIHAFDNVKAVLFVAAVSAYDLRLAEDNSTNQMDEALMLFEEISNSPFFKNAALILFLNKMDLLEEKISFGLSPVSRYDSSYQGGATDVAAAQKYFADRFQRQYRNNTKKPMYIHHTNATDTGLLKRTLHSVQLTVTQHNLERLML